MPPDVHATATDMTETLTPQEAARVLKDASRWEDALVQRTEGITWMVWGLATPATFLTYAFAGVLTELGGIRLGWIWSVLWLPWILAGVATTTAIWRSAALTSPRLHDPKEQRRAGVYSLLFGLGLFLAFLALKPESAIIPLGVIGAGWTLMGIIDPWCATPRGRRVTLFIGLTTVAAALALALASVGAATATMTSLLVSGVLPVGAGLFHTLRG